MEQVSVLSGKRDITGENVNRVTEKEVSEVSDKGPRGRDCGAGKAENCAHFTSQNEKVPAKAPDSEAKTVLRANQF